jgi:hypothetical protein
LLKAEKQRQPNLWQSLGMVSVLAEQRKSEKLIMPLSLEEQLRSIGFSQQAIQDAAESVHFDKRSLT